MTVQYKPISQDPLWNSGVLGSSRGKEDPVPDGAVPHVYFPLRKGCRVTMYNDAHQVSTVLLYSSTKRSRCSKAVCNVMHDCQVLPPCAGGPRGNMPAVIRVMLLDICTAWPTCLHSLQV